MFSLLSLQNRYVLTKRDGIESAADIFRWWNNENKCSLLLAFSGEDSLLTVPFSVKNADIISREVYLWTGNFVLGVSLFMHQFSPGTVFRVHCKDAFKHIAFKSRLRPHQKYQYNHFLESFWCSLQVFLTFLITVIHSVKVPLVTRWII